MSSYLERRIAQLEKLVSQLNGRVSSIPVRFGLGGGGGRAVELVILGGGNHPCGGCYQASTVIRATTVFDKAASSFATVNVASAGGEEVMARDLHEVGTTEHGLTASPFEVKLFYAMDSGQVDGDGLRVLDLICGVVLDEC